MEISLQTLIMEKLVLKSRNLMGWDRGPNGGLLWIPIDLPKREIGIEGYIRNLPTR